jgi:hypothetical protein
MTQKANPYNARKDYHTADPESMGEADGLFRPSAKKATSEEAPSQAEVDYKKRYDDLKKHYDQTVAENKQKSEQEKAVVKAEVNPSTKKTLRTPEELAQFKEDYPDLYDTMSSVSDLQSAAANKDLQERLDALSAQADKVNQREAAAILREKHPDFDTIKDSDAFHSWAKEQPEEVQNWIYKNTTNPDLASKALSYYKADTGYKASSSTNKSNSSAADMVSSKTQGATDTTKKIWTTSEIDKLSAAQYEKLEDELDLAASEGRVKRG